MQISTNYIQERFPIFGYSTLHKYKNDKDSNYFFNSKKDFYFFLEASYLLEFKTRKKLIKTINFKDIYFFTYVKNIKEHIYQPNPIKSLIKSFERLTSKNFLYTPELLIEAIKYIKNYKNKSKEELQSDINQLVEKLIPKLTNYNKQTIIEKFEQKLLSKDINYFDQWVIIEIISNIKEYLSGEKNTIDYKYFKDLDLVDFNTNNKVLEITVPTNNSSKKKEIFFLEKNKTSNRITIREKIESNRNKNQIKEIRTKKLEEPKWVFFSEENTDKYIDHLFNFIEINYEDKYFQYNSVRLPLDIFLQ